MFQETFPGGFSLQSDPEIANDDVQGSSLRQLKTVATTGQRKVKLPPFVTSPVGPIISERKSLFVGSKFSGTHSGCASGNDEGSADAIFKPVHVSTSREM